MENAQIASREFLEHRLRRVLRLLHTNLVHVRESAVGDARADEVSCATAQLCCALRRNGHLEDAALCDELLAVADERLRAPSVANALLWEPARVPMLSRGTTLLNEMGRTDPRFDISAISAWETRFRESTEDVPVQVLAARWSAQRFGWESDARIPETSLLLRKPFAPMMSPADFRAYAHSLFYVTDYGRCALPAKPLPRDAWDVLDGAIVWNLLALDFDRLTELLLAAIYAGMPATQAFRAGLYALLVAWDEQGYVPGCECDPGDGDAKALFFAIVHANIHAALLCSEMLAREVRLQPAPAGEASAARTARAILESRLGAHVATRVQALMGTAALDALEGDLLVARGFALRDIEDISAGVRCGTATWMMRCAAEWLAMVKSVAETTRYTDTRIATGRAVVT